MKYEILFEEIKSELDDFLTDNEVDVEENVLNDLVDFVINLIDYDK